MAKLFLMMGVPGSGKSTWIKRQLTEGDVYISRDEIRFKMLDKNSTTDYFAYEDEVFNEYLRQMNTALENEKVKRIFMDATQTNKKARAKVLNSVKIKPEFIDVIWIRTPLMECYKRNANRTGREFVPKHVIKSMYDRQEEPSWDEGIDRYYIVDNKSKELRLVCLGGLNDEEFRY